MPVLSELYVESIHSVTEYERSRFLLKLTEDCIDALVLGPRVDLVVVAK